MNSIYLQHSRQTGKSWLPSLALLLMTFSVMQFAYADSTANFSVVHSFASNEGSLPNGALLQGADGRFYGNTAMGGANGLGTIYAVTATGTLTVLHTFSGSDGASPVGPLVAGVNGTFYGVTEFGGSNDSGVVFSITSGGQFTLLYSFAAWVDGANADGIAPRGGLILGSDGNFYGATTRGGTNDAGTLFRITPSGVLTTLYSFSAFNSSQSDGALPGTALVVGSDGRFYGTTAVGGTNYNGNLAPGTLYAVGLDGKFGALHSFTASTDGASPSGLVVAGDGSFYGATSVGSNNGSGTLFKATSQGDITTLYSFSAITNTSSGLQTNSEGAFPVSGILAGSDGTLYGGTAFGGSSGSGTLFSLAPNGTLSVLHQFSSLSNGINSDGAVVTSTPIRARDGNLYGVTAWGGSNGAGVIYKLAMPAIPTVKLKLSSTQIASGDSASLTWSTTGASTCSASDGWSGTQATNGSVTIKPTATTTYTLSCSNISGTTVTSATMTVAASDGSTTPVAGSDGSTNAGSGNSGSGGGGAMPLWLMGWGIFAGIRSRRRLVSSVGR